MTQEEEFNLFKEWLLPKLEFKKGAYYTQDMYDAKKYDVKIGIIVSWQEMDEFYKLLDEKRK
jgi:hypothetical protein